MGETYTITSNIAAFYLTLFIMVITRFFENKQNDHHGLDKCTDFCQVYCMCHSVTDTVLSYSVIPEAIFRNDTPVLYLRSKRCATQVQHHIEAAAVSSVWKWG